MRKSKPAAETALGRLEHSVRPIVLRASWLSAASALIWPMQAACVAWFLSGLLQPDASAPFAALAGFVALGLLRAWIGAQADGLLQTAARGLVSRLRTEIIHTETTRARTGAFGGPGAVGALVSTKLDLLIPYITRYQPARMRVLLVPPVILLLSFWQAWAVGLVLLVAGPLIPVFMALVGWAAKEASARQLTEIGDMNDLLVERLSALPDIRALGATLPVQTGFAAKADDLRRRTMAVSCRGLHVIDRAGAVLCPWGGAGRGIRRVFLAGCCDFRVMGGAAFTGCRYFLASIGARILPTTARSCQRVA